MKRLISLAAVIFSIFIISFGSASDNTTAHADFGGVSHGHSHSHSHSYSHHSYRRTRSGSNDDSDNSPLKYAVAGIVAVGFFAYFKLNKYEESKNYEYNVFTIKPNFDKDDMNAHIRNIFTELQEAWMIKDISSVRRYLTERYFEKNQKILEKTLINPDLCNIIEDIDIAYVRITDCAKLFGKYAFRAEIKVKMLDYTVKRNSDIIDGEIVIDGNSELRVTRIYTYEFECPENSAYPEKWKLNNIKLEKQLV